MVRGTFSDRGGFTLLEVLIAFAILAVGVVSLIQLTSQGMRLLKVSGDHQLAVQIADRLARDTQVQANADDEVSKDAKNEPTVETGEEGAFTWERRVTRIALPEELEPQTPVPGKEVPGLYAVAVAVRWGRNQMVEVATLRAPTPTNPASATGTNSADQQGQTPGQPGTTPGGTPAAPGTPATSGRNQTSPFGSGSSTGSGSR